MVRDRDKGICIVCGLDTLRIERRHGKIWREKSHKHARRFSRRIGAGKRYTFWDMDHIKPVVEGGGGCGLDNLRTLCIWCHKKETAELAARRAKKGRNVGLLWLFGEGV